MRVAPSAADARKKSCKRWHSSLDKPSASNSIMLRRQTLPVLSIDTIVPHTQQTFEDLVAILTHGERVPQDWRSLVALASETLTIGSLADCVLAERWNVPVPQELRELLEDVRERAQKRNRLVTSQFCELLGPLNAVGVRPVVMKGLARLLASPDERSRILSDIDLLVPPDRRSDCVQVFTSLGYQIIVGADDDSFPPVFARSRDVGTVDLHTRLKPPDLALGYDDVAPHCRELQLAEGIALLPNATCELVLAILHDQLNDRDYWRGFIDVRHLIDLDRLA